LIDQSNLAAFLMPACAAAAAAEHRALAAGELGVGLVGAAGVGEQALLGHVGQHLDVAHVQRRVD
jgi:hypothetical protein